MPGLTPAAMISVDCFMKQASDNAPGGRTWSVLHRKGGGQIVASIKRKAASQVGHGLTIDQLFKGEGVR